MKKIMFAAAAAALLTATSCTSLNRAMHTPNHRVEFEKSDFEFTGQVTGEAQQTRILGIDWKRLFKVENGEIRAGSVPINPMAVLSSVPIVGTISSFSNVEGLALYDLMQKNQGYDVVFFPTFEKKTTWFVVGRKTTVKATARLGKLK